MGAEKILAFRLWKSGNLERLIQDQNWLASSTEISIVIILSQMCFCQKQDMKKMMSIPVVCTKEACVALKAKQTQLMALVGPV